MTENGARPPDPERWPDAGPVKLKDKIENTLSQGQKFTLKKLAEVVGGPTKTAYSQTSRAVYQMLDAGLLVSLENPENRKKRIFRWSYFEADDPTPLAPAMGDFMDSDPSVLFEPSNPYGYRSRSAFRWKRVRGKELWEEDPGGIEQMSDDEVLMLLQDVTVHQGTQKIFMPNAPGHKRPATVTGFEMLAWASSRGFGGGARSVITRWIGQTVDARPIALWLPECLIGTANKGYRLHPLVSQNLKMVSAIKGMFHPPDSCWGCPGSLVREIMTEAANVWRVRSFVGS